MLSLRSLRRGPAALIALLLLVALVAACGDDGGGDSDGGDGAATTTSTATAGTDGGATTEPTPAATEDAGGGDESDGLRSVDDLDSYRFEMTMEISPAAFGEGLPAGGDDLGMQAEGAVVAPDRNQVSMQANFGILSFDLERTQIGEEAWIRENGGEWTPEAEAAGTSGELDVDVTPEDFLGTGLTAEELQARLAEHPSEEETVDGIETRRYEFTQEEFEALFASEGAMPLPTEPGLITESTTTIWFAEDLGVPVKMTIEGTSAEGDSLFRMDLRMYDINSDDISIEPPV